jgi:hypothetical protein
MSVEAFNRQRLEGVSVFEDDLASLKSLTA